MFNDTMARSIHLTFAIFLVYLCYPLWTAPAGGCRPTLLAAIAATAPVPYGPCRISTRRGRPLAWARCVGVVACWKPPAAASASR
jgi:TRAP-type uncharacterized transport system fused permease subunit